MSSESLLNSFMESTEAVGELSTEYLLCPELDSCPATIKEVKFDEGSKNNGEKEVPWLAFTLRFNVDSEEAREVTGRDEVLVWGGRNFLALTPDNQIDPLNNQGLARLVKLFNLEGLDFKELFDSFPGQYCSVKVKHRALSNKEGPILDEEGNQRFLAEVTAVGKPE
jgi:hypothetical protein